MSASHDGKCSSEHCYNTCTKKCDECHEKYCDGCISEYGEQSICHRCFVCCRYCYLCHRHEDLRWFTSCEKCTASICGSCDEPHNFEDDMLLCYECRAENKKMSQIEVYKTAIEKFASDNHDLMAYLKEHL